MLAQFLFGSLCGLGGAIALFYWLAQKNRVVKTDAEAVYSPAGTRVPFDAITGLGVKKWDSKGLATVRYEIDGRKGEFLLDDYKFERDPDPRDLRRDQGAARASKRGAATALSAELYRRRRAPKE